MEAQEPGPEESPFPFSWAQFTTWFAQLEKNQLEPARQTFFRLLTAKLDNDLSQFERRRIRVTQGRVKSAGRTWTKMTKKKYHSQIDSLSVIPRVIDDLVGIRAICNNLSDVYRLQDILADLPAETEAEHFSLAIEPNSAKDYFDTPKESGYRAYHLNLVTLVPSYNGHHRVCGELQVRTLLQDGWGELTHEDTYKPGVALPGLATTIARRMADLLSAVDDMAQDLRDELDRIAESSVSDEQAEDPRATAAALPDIQRKSPAEAISLSSREALLAEVRTIVNNLDRPAALTEISQQVQSKFGTELTRGWAGYGTFRNLLDKAVPEGAAIGVPPGVVIPVGKFQEGSFEIGVDREIPSLITRLRQRDRNTPAISSRKIAHVLGVVHDALSAEVWTDLGLPTDGSLAIRDVNTLSRYARNTGSEKGEIVSRSHLDYIFKALLWSGNLRPDLGLSEIGAQLVEHLLTRATQLGFDSTATDRREIENWLTVDGSSN